MVLTFWRTLLPLFINEADEISAIIIFFVVSYPDLEHSSPLHNGHEEPMSSDWEWWKSGVTYSALIFIICKSVSLHFMLAVLEWHQWKEAEFLSAQGPHRIFLSIPLFSCLAHAGSPCTKSPCHIRDTSHQFWGGKFWRIWMFLVQVSSHVLLEVITCYKITDKQKRRII